MKFFLAVATAAGLVAGSTFAQPPSTPGAGPSTGVELKDLKQKASYSYGYNMGRTLKAQAIDLDPELIARGLADAFGGGAAALKDEEIQASLQAFAKQLQAR